MSNMMLISEMLTSPSKNYQDIETRTNENLRVMIPGIIQSFDASAMTCTVKCAIRENIKNYDAGKYEDIELPLLQDVPIVFPSAGNYQITFPISQGDECVVLFADMCIDNWWLNGGIQNQFEKRRHDLSDAFCMPAKMSQSKKISSFNTNCLEIKNSASGVKIELQDDKVVADGVNIGKLKADYDALKADHDALKVTVQTLSNDLTTLTNRYNSHYHGVMVTGVSAGDSGAEGSTGGPL